MGFVSQAKKTLSLSFYIWGEGECGTKNNKK